MNYKKYFQIIWLYFVFSISSLAQEVEIKNDFFYIDGEKFFVKGIGYEVSALPGEVPWENFFNPKQMHFDIQRILDAGYNTIRTWAPFSEEELDLLQLYDIKIIMGIWIDPHADFSDPSFFNQASFEVMDVLGYSSAYDNIIGYLIMNEPLPETIFSVGYDETKEFWTDIIDIVHLFHPDIPVSISNTSNGTYIESSLFDFSAYNAYIYNPVTVNYLHEYRDFIQYLNQLKNSDQPLIISEYGLSVSPTGPGSWGYGGNTTDEQATGILHMYKSLVDGGASGSCVFNYSDGWWKSGNEFYHDDNPEEWFGLVNYSNLDDTIGEIRPAWNAVKEYQSAIITQPRSSEIYGNKVPIEIFVNDTIKNIEVLKNNVPINQYDVTNEIINDTLFFETSNMEDVLLIFNCYDKDMKLVKSEEKNILITQSEYSLPNIKISTNEDIWQLRSINVKYEINKSAGFIIDTVVDYIYYPHQGFEYGEKFQTNMPNGENVDISSSHEINSNVNVITVGAAFNISFNNFKKRIVNQLTLSKTEMLSSITEKKVSQIKIFPNPASEFIRVFINNSRSSEYFSYIIFNNFGSVVSQSIASYDNVIDISRLQPGIYYLKISDEIRSISEFKKLIVINRN